MCSCRGPGVFGYRYQMAELLATDRLVLRDWTEDDAEAALTIYGAPEVAQWLIPAMELIPDTAAMRRLLTQWAHERDTAEPATGRWAIVLREDGRVIGGATLRRLPVPGNDVEIAWQLDPVHWGRGYATEAGLGLARYAFDQDVDELFAVSRPRNTRAAATARRMGMQWVGETDKYYGMRLEVYRLRRSDLRDDRDG